LRISPSQSSSIPPEKRKTDYFRTHLQHMNSFPRSSKMTKTVNEKQGGSSRTDPRGMRKKVTEGLSENSGEDHVFSLQQMNCLGTYPDKKDAGGVREKRVTSQTTEGRSPLTGGSLFNRRKQKHRNRWPSAGKTKAQTLEQDWSQGRATLESWHDERTRVKTQHTRD